MSEHSATAEQIGKAGTKLFVITYGGKQEDSLIKQSAIYKIHGYGIIK